MLHRRTDTAGGVAHAARRDVCQSLGRDEQARSVRWLALVGSVIRFLITLPLYSRFQLGTSAMQFVENQPWIDRLNVN